MEYGIPSDSTNLSPKSLLFPYVHKQKALLFALLCFFTQSLTMSSTPAGTTMGLKDRECGQMGVTMMAGTFGWIIEAPAAAAYAVLPVGVDTITPGGHGTFSLCF